MINYKEAISGNSYELAKLLNHYEIHLDWFNANTFMAPKELFEALYPMLMGEEAVPLPVAKGSITKEHADSYGKKLENICDSAEVELVEGKWRSKILAEASYGTPEEYEESYCYHCDETWPEGNICPKCGEETHHIAGEYDEDTMEYQAENVREVLREYCEAVEGKYDLLYIEGRNLNWRGSNGHTTIAIDWEGLLDTVTVNSDYTLDIRHMTDNTLEVVCCHHDANSSYEVVPAYSCDLSNDTPILEEDLPRAEELGEILNLLYSVDYYHKVSSDSFHEEFAGGNYINGLPDAAFQLVKSIRSTITLEQAQWIKELIDASVCDN